MAETTTNLLPPQWSNETPYGVREDALGDFLGYGSAKRQREFDYYMATHQYQMATDDMKKAGLNPGLLYGGAETPGMPNNAAGATGKGLSLLGTTAAIMFGGAKLMQAAKSQTLDAMIAKETMKMAAKSTAKSLMNNHTEIQGFRN